MIGIRNIKKSFGKFNVLKGINLNLEKGKVYAFLGPNGSGKTTLLKCILGLVRPDSGEILINRRAVSTDWRYRQEVGYMPQIAQFPGNLKVKELFNMIKDVRKQNAEDVRLTEFFDMEHTLEKKLKNLSGGMKQKVNAIMAFMFDPAILILDEPSVGLDPVSHIKLKDLVHLERNKGKTILLTTHILSDVEELADKIVYLMEGRIYFKRSPEELLESQKETRIDKAIAKITDLRKFEESELKEIFAKSV